MDLLRARSRREPHPARRSLLHRLGPRVRTGQGPVRGGRPRLRLANPTAPPRRDPAHGDDPDRGRDRLAGTALAVAGDPQRRLRRARPRLALRRLRGGARRRSAGARRHAGPRPRRAVGHDARTRTTSPRSSTSAATTPRLLGAVNCVVPLAAGRLRGENTDGAGFVAALREAGVDPAGRRMPGPRCRRCGPLGGAGARPGGRPRRSASSTGRRRRPSGPRPWRARSGASPTVGRRRDRRQRHDRRHGRHRRAPARRR